MYIIQVINSASMLKIMISHQYGTLAGAFEALEPARQPLNVIYA